MAQRESKQDRGGQDGNAEQHTRSDQQAGVGRLIGMRLLRQVGILRGVRPQDGFAGTARRFPRD